MVARGVGGAAAWITAGLAIAAGCMALGQLGEARAARLERARLRKEQAQPYVVAFIDFSEVSTFLVDLVVRNFGATAAHDVRLDIDPIPRRRIDQERQTDSRADELNADHQTNMDEDPNSDGKHDEYVCLLNGFRFCCRGRSGGRSGTRAGPWTATYPTITPRRSRLGIRKASRTASSVISTGAWSKTARWFTCTARIRQPRRFRR
jgi:hypothetical protein